MANSKGRKGWVMLGKYLDIEAVHGEGKRSSATVTTLAD
jgi:hypothetical protein